MLPATAAIGTVTLRVRDADRSTAFYRDVLGFSEMGSRDGLRALGVHGRTLLYLEESPDAVPRPRRSAGLFHVAILVPSRAALAASLRHLVTHRWPLSGAADHRVSEALYLNDPDGLGLEIYRDRPRESWVTDGEEIVMGTDPLDLEGLLHESRVDEAWRGLEPGTSIGHVHLQVPDLDAAEVLYCGDIGFTPTLRRYPGALFVAAGNYHHHLGLNVWAGRGVPPPPERAVGLREFTIEAAGLPTLHLHDPSTDLRITLTSPSGPVT